MGERFANAQFYYACKKHVAQSNDGTYLAIFHLDLGGNEIRQYKEIAVLGPSTLSRLRECSYRSLFLFYNACHNQNIVQWKTEFVFPLIFITRSF